MFRYLARLLISIPGATLYDLRDVLDPKNILVVLAPQRQRVSEKRAENESTEL
jgi:hypothetical protein